MGVEMNEHGVDCCIFTVGAEKPEKGTEKGGKGWWKIAGHWQEAGIR
jgi:hypothetical protein